MSWINYREMIKIKESNKTTENENEEMKGKQHEVVISMIYYY
jgi:hypothetical protein